MATHRYTVTVDDPSRRERLAATLWQAGAVGIWQRDEGDGGQLVAWFAEPVAALPGNGRWTEEPDRDWLTVWKSGLEPVRVGRLTVAPSWSGHRPGPTTVVVDPGMAFGTGHHATTRLCLEALQRFPLTGLRVADVGTGSGLLAIAAARLGAEEVVAVDIDADAVRIARDNAERNRVAVDVRHGSVEALRDSSSDRGSRQNLRDSSSDSGSRQNLTDGPFDVVVANLTTATVTELAADLVAAATPGGRVVVSGVSTARVDVARHAVESAGGRSVATSSEGDWVALVATAPPADETRDRRPGRDVPGDTAP